MKKEYRIRKHNWREEDTGQIKSTYYVQERYKDNVGFFIEKYRWSKWKELKKDYLAWDSIYRAPIEFDTLKQARKYMNNMRQEIKKENEYIT